MSLSSSIDIGQSGLIGFSQELQIISNNVANLNTPGFKGSGAQFADLFSANNGLGGQGANEESGGGLQVLPSVINFSGGQETQTGVTTNLFINGNSFFVTRDPKTGQIAYTQDGQFAFTKGYLTNSTGDTRVQGLTSSGGLQDISLSGLENSAPKVSTNITLNGNLSTTATPANPATISSIVVFDATGASHALSATLAPGTTAGGQTPWTVTLSDGATPAGSGLVYFASPAGTAVTGKNSFQFTYTPSGGTAIQLTLTMDPNSTSTNSQSSVSVESVDGYGAGTMTSETFNASGQLQLTYSNGQTATGPTIALANFQSTTALKQNGANGFVASNNNSAQLGTAGATSAWGTVTAGAIEGSNVDLSTEFSDIIVTQRGYQAASELISTANQMMQDVLQMKGQGG